jgi:alanine dehydrogenase
MTSPETFVIAAAEIEAGFRMPEAVECVEDAFRLYGEGKVQMPPKVYLTFEWGDLRTMPVYVPTLGVAGVKNVNVHPGNRGMPTVMATITLVDPRTGFPLAIMDGTYLTSLRTGAAGAVAARYLAREDARVAGFVGAGRQAATQLDGLMITRPGIRSVLACDLDTDSSRRFCLQCRERYDIEAASAASIEEVVRSSDILTTTTPARTPIVRDEWVRPGTHINAIGADAPGKQELDPAILKRARIVIDSWEQASHSGEINVPLAQGLLTRDDIACDIGELVTGRKPGRTRPDDVTVFDSTGLAVQDIACACAVYRKLASDEQALARIRRIRFF